VSRGGNLNIERNQATGGRGGRDAKKPKSFLPMYKKLVTVDYRGLGDQKEETGSFSQEVRGRTINIIPPQGFKRKT